MKKEFKGSYGDIINLPHHQSAVRPHMSLTDRAAQFSPFSALTGYEAAVLEAARYTEAAVTLAEDQMEMLDKKFQRLSVHLSECPLISVTYFFPDNKKEGGRYLQHTGKIKKIDTQSRRLIFQDKTEIFLDQITDMQTDFCD